MNIARPWLETIEALRDVAEENVLTAAQARRIEEAADLLESLAPPEEPLSRDEVAQQTGSMACHCGNCGHEWTAGWFPMDALLMCRITLRYAICARCGGAGSVGRAPSAPPAEGGAHA